MSTLESIQTLIKENPRLSIGVGIGVILSSFLLNRRNLIFLKLGFRFYISPWITRTFFGTFKEEMVLNYVFSHSNPGDTNGVLAAMDEFCKSNLMMNIGILKGSFLDDAGLKRKPKFVVELGAYFGYSAVRIGRLLSDDARLVSIEKNPLFAAISTKIIEHAGLSNKVKVLVGKAEDKIPTLKQVFGIEFIDLVFIDHWKDRYVPDLKVIESNELLCKGSVLVADNVILPGAPDYLKYIRNNPKYESKLYESPLDFTDYLKDGVEISVFKG